MNATVLFSALRTIELRLFNAGHIIVINENTLPINNKLNILVPGAYSSDESGFFY